MLKHLSVNHNIHWILNKSVHYPVNQTQSIDNTKKKEEENGRKKSKRFYQQGLLVFKPKLCFLFQNNSSASLNSMDLDLFLMRWWSGVLLCETGNGAIEVDDCLECVSTWGVKTRLLFQRFSFLMKWLFKVNRAQILFTNFIWMEHRASSGVSGVWRGRAGAPGPPPPWAPNNLDTLVTVALMNSVISIDRLQDLKQLRRWNASALLWNLKL